MRYDGKFNHTTGVYNTPTGARPEQKENKMRISTDAKNILESALQRWGRENDVIIQSTRSIFDRNLPEVYEVNWGSFGSQPTDNAREYALTIYRACEIADTLNSLEIVEEDRELDIDKETYYNSIEKIKNGFESGNAWVAQIVLQKIDAEY